MGDGRAEFLGQLYNKLMNNNAAAAAADDDDDDVGWSSL